MSMPPISIIVPVYKVEKYIHRCVDSILAQTFTDFEVILVDDGSPDNCAAICDEYAAKDSRIRVFHQTNNGPAAARNNGVQNARGCYVTFIDADDYVPDKYIEFLLAGITNFNADISVVLEVECNNCEEISPIYKNDYMCLNSDAAIRYTFHNFDSSFRSPWAKLVLRSIVQAEPFPVDRYYSEDTATVYRWYCRANKVALNSSKLYYYVRNDLSLVHSPFNYSRLGIFKTYDEISNFFLSNGFEDLYPSLVKIYMDVACSHYEQLINDLQDQKTARNVRKHLKKLLQIGKKLAIATPTNAPHCYNIVYPLRMNIYWTAIGLVNKIRSSLGRR